MSQERFYNMRVEYTKDAKKVKLCMTVEVKERRNQNDFTLREAGSGTDRGFKQCTNGKYAHNEGWHNWLPQDGPAQGNTNGGDTWDVDLLNPANPNGYKFTMIKEVWV